MTWDKHQWDAFEWASPHPVDDALDLRMEIKTLAGLTDVPVVEIMDAIERGELKHVSKREGPTVSWRDWHAYRSNQHEARHVARS